MAKWNRYFFAGAVLFLLLGCILTACNGGERQGEKDKQTAQVDEQYGYQSPVQIKVGLSYAVDLTWVGDETPEDNAWMDLYQEHNIYPEIMYVVDESQDESRLAAAIMSGDYPDILHGGLQEYVDWARNSVTADITEAYNAYASDELKEYMESDGGKGLEMLRVDGKLFGLPRLDSAYEQIPVMFIRQDWLEHLGLEIPGTMEELKQVAYAFTHEDPDGNGIDDTYGLAIDGMSVINNTIGDCSPIFAAYGAYLGNDAMAFICDENGEVMWGGSDVSAMKQALQFLQDLYVNGAICQDAVTMNSNAVFEDAGSGKCGIWFAPLWGGMIPASDLAKLDRDFCVIAAPVPKGGEEEVKAYMPSPVRGVYCVSSQCKNPEVLIKLMNLAVQKLHPETEEEYVKYMGDNKNYTGAKTSLIYLLDTHGHENYKKISEAMKTKDESGLNLLQQMDLDKINAYLEAKERGEFDPYDSQQSLGISYYTVNGGEHCSWSVIDHMIQRELFVYPAYNDLYTDIMINNMDSLRYQTVETIVKIMTGENVDQYDGFLETWYLMGGKKIEDEIAAGIGRGDE